MFPLCPLSGEFLIINGSWILSKAFSASIQMIIWFLFVSLLIWHITLVVLWILKNPCILGINPTWSWCMIFLRYCWIWFASILLKVFVFVFISDVGLQFSFFCVGFVWFWYQGDGGLIEWVWECSFLLSVLEEFHKDRC